MGSIYRLSMRKREMCTEKNSHFDEIIKRRPEWAGTKLTR